ncbi:MAG: hypothetical protein SV062_14420 [Thermodesulfobacteriota bacterium]|nr:hypothetical protein [Thermodesulfobacteriota bacterium]
MLKHSTIILSSLILILTVFAAIVLCADSLPAESVDLYVEQASKYFLEGRYNDGISAAKSSVDLNPNDPRGYNFLVANYAGLGNYYDAIKASKKQLEIIESKGIFDVNIVTRHAALLEVGFNHDKAIAFLKAYRKRFPRTISTSIEGLKKAKVKKAFYYPYFRQP